jgi:putative phage-type endonuclease
MKGDFRTLVFGDESAWLQERRARIGSSEIGGLLGLGYADQTPYTIWLEKTTGQRLPKDAAFLQLMEVGHAAESFLRDCFRIKTGKVCHFDAEKTVRVSDRYPAFAASLDGWCDGDGGSHEVVELKMIGMHMRAEYVADELPLKFTLQVQHQMAVTGAANGWLFAMCGTEMILRHVPRHDRLIEGMHKHAEAFLELVKSGTPPEVDGKLATTKAITIYAGEPVPKKIVSLPAEFDGVSDRIAELQMREKDAVEEYTRLKNQVRSVMGDAEWAYEPNGSTFSWKQGKAGRTFRAAKAPAEVRLHQLATGEF